MKKTFTLSLAITFGALILYTGAWAQSVGISSSPITPDASSVLDVRSTAKGVLLPRLTNGQRDAIAAPASGLTIYNTSVNRYEYWDGVTWQQLVPGGLQAIDAGNGLNLNVSNPLLPKVELGGPLDQETSVRLNTHTMRFALSNVGGRLAVGALTYNPDPNFALSVKHPTSSAGDNVTIGGTANGVTASTDGPNETGILGENITNTASGTSYGVLGRMQNLNSATGALGMYSAVGSVGVYGNVTAGATNYSGYFEGGKVQVNANANGFNLPLIVRNHNQTNGSNYVGIAFTNQSGSDGIKSAIVHERTGNFGVGSLHFLVNNNAASATDVTSADIKMSVLPNGNIGVGTTAPNAPFAVRTATATANARSASLVNAIGDNNFHLVADRGFTTNLSGDLTVQFGQAYGAGAISEGIKFLRGAGSSDGAMIFVTNGGTSRMTISNNGTVGIGSANQFTVNSSGNITMINSIGYSWPSSQGAANSALVNNGSGTLTWTAPGGTGAGLPAGTNGQTLRHNGTSWVANSLLFNNGTSVGINTTTPGQALDVNGRIRLVNANTELYHSSNRLLVRAENTDNVAQFANYGIYLPLTGHTYNVYAAQGMQIGYSTANPVLSYRLGDLLFSSDATERMRLTAAGSLGIGTGTPGEVLSVVRPVAGWQSRFQNSSGSGADVYLSHGGGYGMHIRGWNANDGIYTLEMYNNTTLTNAFYNSGRVVLGMVGNVGVGLNNPGYKLDVNASVRISTNNATGGGLFLADDGSMVDNNDGYASMRFSNGVSINGGLNNNIQRILLRSDGNIQMVNNVAPTINFNDIDAQDYYIHTNDDRMYILRGEGYNAWDATRPLTVYQGNKVGINNATTPAVSLAVGGNGANVYATDAWIENNIHVQGNETLVVGGRGRLRVGTAWGYVGLYADGSSSGANNDLVLGASSSYVRIGPDGGNQRLYVGHNTKSIGSFGIYQYNSGNVNAGNGYGQGNVSAGIKSYSFWGNTYDFAIAGYSYNDNNRSGGMIGGNQGGGTWEASGYRNSGGTLYGEYYTSTSWGGGFLPQGGQAANIGSGGYGDFMGAWTRGGVIGQISAGEVMASYNLGDEYTSGRQIEVVEKNGVRNLAYTTTSTEAQVSKAGMAQLSGGSASVNFDPAFAALIADDEMPIVTVTPVGECKGLSLVSAGKGGFSVKELQGGTSNVQFTYIVMAKRADAKAPALMQGITEKEFDTNLREALFNEAIRERDAKPMWWDGQTIQFSPIPESLNPVKRK